MLPIDKLTRVNPGNPSELWYIEMLGKSWQYMTARRDPSRPHQSYAWLGWDQELESNYYYLRHSWELQEHLPLTAENAAEVLLRVLLEGVQSNYEWTVPV